MQLDVENALAEIAGAEADNAKLHCICKSLYGEVIR
jgi:hypothetical protein